MQSSLVLWGICVAICGLIFGYFIMNIIIGKFNLIGDLSLVIGIIMICIGFFSN